MGLCGEEVPSNDFSRLLEKRRSVRSFLVNPVSKELIDEILLLAAKAPSGTNIQPWRVHVLSGAKRQQLVEKVCAAFDTKDASYQAEYDYYPKEFFEPYLSRRRHVGLNLYRLLGIERGDIVSMQAQHRKNFEFFGAPIGLIFTIDRRMGRGSWIDYGMFLQNVMLAARWLGLDTCPQAAWTTYHRIVEEVVGFESNEQLVCGMAMGYADLSAPENTLVTERAALREFVVFHQDI